MARPAAHLVGQSIEALDPDGHPIEVVVDRNAQPWREDPAKVATRLPPHR
jgi:catechol-2,3-dioxygenase